MQLLHHYTNQVVFPLYNLKQKLGETIHFLNENLKQKVEKIKDLKEKEKN